MAGGEGGLHVPNGLEQGGAVANEDLDDGGGLGHGLRGGQGTGDATGGVAPDMDGVASGAEVFSHTTADDAKTENANGGGGVHGWEMVQWVTPVCKGWVTGRFLDRIAGWAGFTGVGWGCLGEMRWRGGRGLFLQDLQDGRINGIF